MKVCPKCQVKNRDTARYCSRCSAVLPQELICGFCNTENPASARYCNYCASPLRGSSGWQTPTGALIPGTIIATRYFIIRKLGEGGMGAVYLVTDSRLGGRKCALKEMSNSPTTDPAEMQQAKEAFQREAEMLSDLSHPALPRVTDYFTLSNKHYLVMDFADGRPLDEILDKRTRPFPVSQVVAWAVQICDVFSYLHAQTPPIIYRDLKPGNIMLSPDRISVKLIDFGIARTYKQKSTKDTIAMGTPGYAPPEQYGKGQTDQRSDVYALGATMHHLLTLQDPGDDPFKFREARALNPRVPRETSRVIMKAVQQDRVKRWQSAKEMAQALKENSIPRKVSKPVGAAQPAANLKSPPKPAPASPKTGSIPSKPLASLAASFLSKGGPLSPPAKPTLWDKIRRVFNQASHLRTSFHSINLRSKIVWRDYIWVAGFCLVSVVINLLLDERYSIGIWGYWGEILGSVLSPLPFLLSAVFANRIGTVLIPAFLAGLVNSGFVIQIFLVAMCSELPFLLTGYRKNNYLILFVAALIFGVGNYILFSPVGNSYLAFDNIIKTWIVAFISPLLATLVGRITKRI